jgi:hypothetical protein
MTMDSKAQRFFQTFRPFRFTTLARARSFADHTVKASDIVLGDDEYFWVVTLGEAERLVRWGYERAQ